jgi:cytochrome c oxidase assembly protein subunit 11
MSERNQTVALYMLSLAVGTLGASYASVPLYKMFCQATGFGGTTQRADSLVGRDLSPAEDGRVLKITFTADVNDQLPWKFRPTTNDVKVVPGETALAFYRATNPTSKAITGVATYNVHPPKAGLYFQKVQCFCFEEQRLRPGEEIDMPVFFYIDKEILKDPAMEHVNSITLSYTFFKTGEDGDDAPAAALSPAVK